MADRNTAMHDTNIQVSPSLKAQVAELAWANRTSVNAVVRDIIASYAEGEPDPQPDPDTESLTEGLRISIDLDTWRRAINRAIAEGTTISAVTRKQLELRLASPAA